MSVFRKNELALRHGSVLLLRVRRRTESTQHFLCVLGLTSSVQQRKDFNVVFYLSLRFNSQICSGLYFGLHL